MTLPKNINSSNTLMAAAAFAISIFLLVVIAKLTPATKHTTGLELKEGTWEVEEASQTRRFNIETDVPLRYQVPDKFTCCNGKYHFSIPSSQVLTNSQPPYAVFFPAIGGDFAIRINGTDINIPFNDYSSIGPLVPLNEAHLRHKVVEIDVIMANVGTRYHGLWRGPLVVGNQLELDRVKTSEYNFQVVLPTFVSLLLFIGALAFSAIYIFTEKRFTPYIQFAISLILYAAFSLFLSGLIRNLNMNVSALLHYPIRIVAATSPFIIISNLQSYFSSPDNRLSKREFSATICVFLVAGLISVCANMAGFPKWGTTIMVLTTWLAAWPLMKWKLNDCQFFSMNFLSFTVALAAGLSWLSDSTKVAFGLCGFVYPLNFYNRITTTALIGFSFIFFIRHFIGLSNELAKEKIELARTQAIARTVKMVAHDVRKPFTMIQMAAETLSRLPHEKIPHFTNTLRTEIERSRKNVDRMLRDVLDFGSNSKLRVSSFDLRELIQEVANDTAIDRTSKKANLEVYTPTTIIQADRHKIFRALTNIVDNAAAAVIANGLIKIETTSSPKAVTIQVFNEGSFIEKDKRDLIFSDYFTDGKPQGTGLGLAIAKQFIEAHGGKIWCDSFADRGTSFYLMLPIDQKSSSENSQATTQEM